MSDTTASRAFNWFTPLRFGILLVVLIFAAFPQVLLGLQTFVIRDYGFFSYPLAHFQHDCFWRGELPFWNPYNYCGVPFLASHIPTEASRMRRLLWLEKRVFPARAQLEQAF